jgi:hypothetical protein
VSRTLHRQSFPLVDFAYTVIHRVIDSEVGVLVVRHRRRDPDFGEARR